MQFLTLYDTNLVELIAGYLVPVAIGPVPFCPDWCWIAERSQETLYAYVAINMEDRVRK